jgi:hypothetical protein
LAQAIAEGSQDAKKKPPDGSGGFFKMEVSCGLQDRAAATIGEADTFRATTGKAFNGDTAVSDADDLRAADAFFQRSGAGFTGAAAAITIPFTDDRTDAVRADAQFEILSGSRRDEGGTGD